MSDLVIVSRSEIEAIINRFDRREQAQLIALADLRALLDKATPVSGEAVLSDKNVNELRFFRDLTDAERMKVFKAFGLIPQDYSGFIHLSTQMLFFKKWQSPQPAIPEGYVVSRQFTDMTCYAYIHHNINISWTPCIQQAMVLNSYIEAKYIQAVSKNVGIESTIETLEKAMKG